MTRIIFLAAISVSVLGACRTAHLGDDSTVAYRHAFAAQRESDPENKPSFGADDANATNAARRASKGKAGSSTAPGSITTPMGGGMSGGNGASGAWPGAQGGIKLEAK